MKPGEIDNWSWWGRKDIVMAVLLVSLTILILDVTIHMAKLQDSINLHW